MKSVMQWRVLCKGHLQLIRVPAGWECPRHGRRCAGLAEWSESFYRTKSCGKVLSLERMELWRQAVRNRHAGINRLTDLMWCFYKSLCLCLLLGWWIIAWQRSWKRSMHSSRKHWHQSSGRNRKHNDTYGHKQNSFMQPSNKTAVTFSIFDASFFSLKYHTNVIEIISFAFMK